MPRLVLRVPGENPRHLRLESKPLRLGRSPDCEVVIEHEGISRMHAVLRMASGRIEIEDLGSRNGTYVNDESAGRRALQAGDVVRLGQDVELELAQEAAEAAPDAGQAGRPVVAKRGARPAATKYF